MTGSVAIVLSIVLASPDGGMLSDAPLADQPTGGRAQVVEVQSAVAMDGGVLSDGWWVSRGQMLKLGTKLSECETQPAQAPTWGFWVGLGLGAASAAVAIVAVSNTIGR